MKAMVLEKVGQPLKMLDLPVPSPGENELLVKVSACGVCRTDLHIVDGDLKNPKLPLVMGHQIVGTVEKVGKDVNKVKKGDRIGIPWLSKTCKVCRFCTSNRENLCESARFTGYNVDGGFAEYCLAEEEFSFPIHESYPDIQAAPLLCAGLIGYRSYRMTGKAKKIGFYGFGASAHILTQVVIQEGKEVYAFTKPGDLDKQKFAQRLGAVWAGGSDSTPPCPLDAAIIFAPVGLLVPQALTTVDRGGTIVCAGIHMSDIPSFRYKDLWHERVIRSVANLTRKDGEEFLNLAPKIPIHTEVLEYSLSSVNDALTDLKQGRFSGSAVIKISS